MAKGKSRQKGSGTRDALQSLPVRVRSRSAIGSTLQQVQDLRSFDFEPDTRPALTLRSTVASVGASLPQKPKTAPSKVPYQIAFSAPAETLVCVRRHRRKQVLHALRKTGKGGQKKARWSKWSSYRC